MGSIRAYRDRTRSIIEENTNAMSHGLAFVGFAIAVVFLAQRGFEKGSGEALVAIVYGSALCMTFLASCVYHFVIRGKYKEAVKLVDHLSIFFLIAGTNTPFVYLFMNNQAGKLYLIGLWSLVAIGIVLKVLYINSYPKLLTYYYVLMGWVAILLLPSLWKNLPSEISSLILLGGFFYSVGVFYFLRDHKPWRHFVWHLFVIGGALCHFIAIWKAYTVVG